MRDPKDFEPLASFGTDFPTSLGKFMQALEDLYEETGLHVEGHVFLSDDTHAPSKEEHDQATFSVGALQYSYYQAEATPGVGGYVLRTDS